MAENQTKNRVVIVIVLTSALFGILGGIAGELVARAYLYDNALDIPFFGEINVSSSNFGGPNIVFRDAKKVVIEQDTKAIETADSARDIMVGFYQRINVKEPVVGSTVVNLKDYYDLKSPLGQGIVISSDGWILTNFQPRDLILKDGILSDVKILEKYAVITRNRHVYNIDKILKDTGSEFLFVHINANNLGVRKLLDRTEIKKGQVVVAINWLGEARLSSIADSEYYPEKLVRFSDDLGASLLLADELGQEFNGSMLLNLSNDIVALINSKGKIIPISDFNSAIVSALKYGAIKRSSLGIYYIELKNVIDAKTANNPNTDQEKGVMVYNNDGVAVMADSPAEISGIQKGDILLTFDNREINGTLTLADILKDYMAGDNVKIVYMRNGERLETTLTLAEVQ